MTSEHDRLLAEGPRTAPEPRAAPDFGNPAAPPAPFFDESAAAAPATSAPTPVVQQSSDPSLGARTGSRSRPGRRGLVPFLIPAVVGSLVVARAVFDGHGGSTAFAVVWVVLVALGIALRRRRS
jgi:hypothetical protein